MSWVLIGLIVGSVQSLTGAGGAIIATPLFSKLLHLDFGLATFYSLVTVFAGSSLNCFFQRSLVDYKMAIRLGLFSLLGVILSAPFKAFMPQIGLKILFIAVCIFAFYIIWKPITHAAIKPWMMGIFVGILTTMTGLGGGLILVPALIGMFQMEIEKAVATSLFIIAISSCVSLLSQISFIGIDFPYIFISLMIIGLFLSGTLTSRLIESKAHLDLGRVRRLAISTLIVISVILVAL